MEIRIVRYARLYNLGNYQNERIEVEAAVTDGKNPVETLGDLRIWCAQHSLAPEEALRDLDRDLQRADRTQHELRELQASIKAAREQWQQVKAFMTKAGLPIPNQLEDEIPF